MSDSENKWVELLKSFGLPTVMLCALAFAVWQALVWGGNNLMIPLVNKQIESLEKIDTSQEAITNTQERIANTMSDVKQSVVENKKMIQDMAARQDKNFDEVVTVLQEINKSIKSQ